MGGKIKKKQGSGRKGQLACLCCQESAGLTRGSARLRHIKGERLRQSPAGSCPELV